MEEKFVGWKRNFLFKVGRLTHKKHDDQYSHLLHVLFDNPCDFGQEIRINSI